VRSLDGNASFTRVRPHAAVRGPAIFTATTMPALSSNLPAVDFKSFWGALGRNCWVVRWKSERPERGKKMSISNHLGRPLAHSSVATLSVVGAICYALWGCLLLQAAYVTAIAVALTLNFPTVRGATGSI
jgi:hypothetical protein